MTPLERAREASFTRLGRLSDQVLTRVTPLRPTDAGPQMFFWPSRVTGAIRIVHRAQSVLLVTDGMSDPWSPELHPDPPPFTFGIELALEVPNRALDRTSDEAIAQSWPADVLWALTEWVVAEHFDVKGRLQRLDCITLGAPPVRGLEPLVSKNGFVGVLAGLPWGVPDLGRQALLAPLGDDDGVWLAPVKLLTADEYDWAVAVPDNSRTLALAKAFLRRGDAHWSWAKRPSVLGSLDPE